MTEIFSEDRQRPEGQTEFITMLILKDIMLLESSQLKPIQVQ